MAKIVFDFDRAFFVTKVEEEDDVFNIALDIRHHGDESCKPVKKLLISTEEVKKDVYITMNV